MSEPSPDPSLDPFNPQARTHWIRLRTLIILRWITIAGQMVAVTIADRFFHLRLELGLCYLAIGAAVVANLMAILFYPENKRLPEGEVITMLLFDILQLSFLLYLTGGLNNPFTLLILVPATIAATALSLRATLIVGGTGLLMITVLALMHIPLSGADGQVLRVSSQFITCFWCALAIGLAFLSAYARRISQEIHVMSDALLATQMALVREQKLTDLGGVVAAAAHELGTPLATIKLVSSELVDELDDADLRDDARLIRDQADRCRDILRSMGRAGKDDKHLQIAPIDTVIREAAEPHLGRGRRVHFHVAPGADGENLQPSIRRKPEIIHGLRNLVQNAVDFARANVWIDAQWTATSVLIRITDDGDGYPSQVIGRLGDPFLRRRRQAEDSRRRPEYEGMGLGLFIAKTLLERTGATLAFSNGRDLLPGDAALEGERSGAVVEVIWPLQAIVPEAAGADGRGLGENELIRS